MFSTFSWYGNLEGNEMRDGLNSLLEISLLGFVVVTCLIMANPLV